MAKILLVEDDINLRDVYAARLESEGYEIAVASNGEEALAIAVQEKPDLILLDIMMPKISGFDVLDIIRTTPEIAHTRVIMMTALSGENDRERGEKLGVDKFLVKSQVILEDVVSTIDEVLKSPAKIDSSQPLEQNVAAQTATTSSATQAQPMSNLAQQNSNVQSANTTSTPEAPQPEQNNTTTTSQN